MLAHTTRPHTRTAQGPSREHVVRAELSVSTDADLAAGAHCATFRPAHNTHPTGLLHGRPGNSRRFQRRPGGMTGPRIRAHPGSTARHTPCDHGRDRRGRPQLLRGGAAPPSESLCASNRIKPAVRGDEPRRFFGPPTLWWLVGGFVCNKVGKAWPIA